MAFKRSGVRFSYAPQDIVRASSTALLEAFFFIHSIFPYLGNVDRGLQRNTEDGMAVQDYNQDPRRMRVAVFQSGINIEESMNANNRQKNIEGCQLLEKICKFAEMSLLWLYM